MNSDDKVWNQYWIPKGKPLEIFYQETTFQIVYTNDNVYRTFVLLLCFKVYDPFSNSCVEMKNNVSISDIDFILHGIQDDGLNVKTEKVHSYRSNIRCHHGKMDKINRSCICDDGWESASNFSIPIVSTVPVHMCTIQIPSKNLYLYPSTFAALGLKNTVSFTLWPYIDEFLSPR